MGNVLLRLFPLGLFVVAWEDVQGVATVKGQVWTREYAHATFSVDCSTLEPKMTTR